jgi:hypothetical protein
MAHVGAQRKLHDHQLLVVVVVVVVQTSNFILFAHTTAPTTRVMGCTHRLKSQIKMINNKYYDWDPQSVMMWH